MNNDGFKNVVAPRNQVLWLLLAFQSGFMNAGGFLACHRFVSHMTGYGTYVGVALARKEYLYSFEMALAPLFFLAGAIFSGWITDRRIIQEREPRIEGGIVILAILNLAIYLGEFSGYLGTFGEPLVLQRDFLLLFILSFACGLQNGLFVGVTNGQIRTTHLTGPITDIGINFSRIVSLPVHDPQRRQLSAMNWLRVKIVIAFSTGSMIAALVFTQVNFEGFAVPCATSLFLVWYVRTLMNQQRADDSTASFVAASSGGDQPNSARSHSRTESPHRR